MRRVAPAYGQWKRCVLVACGVSVAACAPQQAITPEQSEAIVRWLTCDECVDGELSYIVDSIGAPATPLLRQALMETPAEYLANAERALRVAYARREAPLLSEDEYVDGFLANYKALLQARAAVALGGLRATNVLREAYEERDTLRFRSDVVAAIEDALAQAGGGIPGLPPAVVSIDLRPDTLDVVLGDSAYLEGVPLDASGQMRAVALTWSISDPTLVAGIDTGATWIRVRGVSVGEATVTATAQSGTSESTVRVTPPAPPPGRLSIVSGSGQTFTVGTPHLPLVVRVEDADGDPILAAQVIFRTTRGGAPVETSALTDVDGEARLEVIAAPLAGAVWVEAAVTATPGGIVVRPSMARFQLRAVP